MIKTVFIMLSVFVFSITYANAGQSGDYIGASSGILFTEASTITDRNGSTANLAYSNIGIPVSAFIGHQFGIGVRVEEEAFYKKFTTHGFSYSGSTSQIDSNVFCFGAMSNLYYDWYHDVKVLEEFPISPYVGLGVGLASVNMSESSVNGLKLWSNGNDTIFTYQLIIGSGIPISKDILLDVSYRHFATKYITIDQTKASLSNQNFLLGVRYFFR